MTSDGSAASLSSRKYLHLLAYLWIHRGQAKSRDQLAGLFWPEAEESDARRNLRQALHQLRRSLNGDGSEENPLLFIQQTSVQLNPNAPCWVDLDAFQQHLEQADDTSGDDRIGHLQEAINLYRGDFLEGCYEEWCLEKRERVRDRYAQALYRLSATHAKMGAYEMAIERMRALLKMKPLDEDVYRQLMVLHYLDGDRSGAFRQYDECVRILSNELEIEPAPETTELYQRIEQNDGLDDLESLPDWFPVAHQAGYLPQPLSRLIGREREIAAVEDQLQETRLLTLTGIGGSGKTRLALEVAHRREEAFEDGVWFVDLAPLTDPQLVPQAVASILGVQQAKVRSTMDDLIDRLQHCQALLVLDNCEHLIEASARLATRLLRACPRLTILATSRERLRVKGEVSWEVPPLDLPTDDSDKNRIEEHDAIQFFVRQVRSHAADFTVTADNTHTVLKICQRLDGLPLALQLAAARVQTMPLADVARRLDDRFSLLNAGDRSSPSRHQTLQATMDWSYELLSEREACLLRRLSVFAGRFSLDTVEAICAERAIEASDVFDLLGRLVEQSLVQVKGDRYRLLETVRKYAEAKLVAVGEMETIKRRHLAFFRERAEEAEPELRGAEQSAWLTRLDAEHDNLRAALTWALQAGQDEEALRLSGALGQFWSIRGYRSEGRRWLERVLESCDTVSQENRAKPLRWLGNLYQEQGSYDRAHEALNESLRIAQDAGNRSLEARILSNLGNVEWRRGNLERARQLLEEGLSMACGLGDQRAMAQNLSNLGKVEDYRGDLAKSRERFEQSLSIQRELGDKRGMARSLSDLGNVESNQGNLAESRRLFEQSLTLHRELGYQEGMAKGLGNLGLVAFHQGNLADSSELLQQCLEIAREIGDKESVAKTLINLGVVEWQRGNLGESRALLQQSLEVNREMGHKRSTARCLHNLGNLELEQGNPEEARKLLVESLRANWDQGERRMLIDNLSGLAAVLFMEDCGHRAAQLQGAVTTLLNQINTVLDGDEQALYDRAAIALREVLGENAYCQAFEKGQALSLEDAVEFAIGDEVDSGRS